MKMTMTMTWLLTSALLLGFGGAAFATAPTFDSVDKNGDGYLSTSEASAVAMLDFEKADADRDGKVTRSEYQVAMQKSDEGETQKK
jgi:hypothetical protein